MNFSYCIYCGSCFDYVFYKE
ncbi:MAG: hypothetical protein ACLR8C_06815 [Finegoldia magna]